MTTVSPVQPIMVARQDEGNSPESGAAKVFAFIRDRLLSGELKVGDRLLSERELSLALGVSRPMLREALRALAVLGLLDIQHGRGAFVREADMTALGDVLTFCLAQRPDAVEDVMQARIAIECQAIRLACQRISEKELQELDARLDAIPTSLNDPEAGGEADYAFHLAIVRASGSPTLLAIYDSIAPLLHRSHIDRRRSTANSPEITSHLPSAHRAIVLSLARGDPDDAERVLREHYRIGDRLRREQLVARLADAARADEPKGTATTSPGPPSPSASDDPSSMPSLPTCPTR
jgi:GntR family transcriptional regulator, transcriptional repressor for pyruvate dehydrogenase complex